MELDLSPLEGLNIPEIKIDPNNEIQLDFGDNSIDADKKDELKDIAVAETESLEEFSKSEVDKEPVDNTEVIDTPDEDTEDKTTEDSKSDEDVSVVKGIVEWGKEKGIWDFDDKDFEDSEDYLQKKFEEVANKRVEEKLKEYPDVIQELAKNYKDGVPLDELIYSKSREIEYSQIKEDDLKGDKANVELQKRLVSDYLANQDFDDSEIEKKLQKYEDTGMLEDEALTAHKKLQRFEQKYQEGLKLEAEERKKNSDKQFQETLKGIQTTVEQSKEIIPGIDLTVDQKKRLFEAYTKVDSRGKTELLKKIESDPNAWLKITQFMVLLEGKLDSVKTQAVTDATKKVKKTVDTTYKESGKQVIDSSALNTIKKALKQVKTQRLKAF
jgi:hypothetical protein